MKWKTVSPDVKRRESPKFRNYQPHEQQIERIPIDLVMKKFEEMERRERELQRELEFYRLKYENGGASGGRENHLNLNVNNYNNLNYRDNFDYYNGSGNSGYDIESVESGNSNYNVYNNDYASYNEVNNNPVSHAQINAIVSDEDELYFYGGGRKRKNREDPEEEEIYTTEKTDDFEFEYYEDLRSESELEFEINESESDYFEDNLKKKKSSKLKKKNVIKPREVRETHTLVKPKAYAPKVIDLDAPTLIKLPPNPIPNTWAHIVSNPLKYEGDKCKEIVSSSILDFKGTTWYSELKRCGPVQGILMRPPFDSSFNVNQWAKFMKTFLPGVLEDGYLFIWVEREELADVVRAAERHLSFKYVENLCWIRRDLGNRLLREPGRLFNKSKLTLLILRRDPNNKCKLRHQRNPDCIFDFAGGDGRMPDGRVYDVIETLLDGSKSKGPHLMHLWAGNSPTDRLVYKSRRQWIRVSELEDADDTEMFDAEKTESTEDIDTNEAINSIDTTEVIDSTDTDTTQVTDTVNPSDITESKNITDNTHHITATSSTFDEDFCNFIICEEPSI